MTLWFFALLFVFAVAPLTVLGLCLVGRGDPNPFLPNSRPMEDWERKDSDEFIASSFRGGIEGHSLDAVERRENTTL